MGRLPVLLAVATVVLALLIGLGAGDLIGRNSVPPAVAQVARYQLVGHGTLAGARGTVVNLKVEGVALVDFTGLPPLAKGKVYQLWLITPGGRPDSAAVFVPDSNGGKGVLVGLPLTGYSQMAATAGGARTGCPAPSAQRELTAICGG